MIRFFHFTWSLLFVAAVSGMQPRQAIAQTPRARSLTYDVQSKEWVEPAPPMLGTSEGDLYAIKECMRLKDYRAVHSQLKTFRRQYGPGDPLYPESLLVEAQAQIGLREFDKAHEVCQTFLNQFAGMSLTEEALRLEFNIAEAFLAGAKTTVWKIFRVSGEDLGLQILDEISAEHTDSPIAELAIKAKGDHLVKTGEHALAEIEYARLMREYPRSRYHHFATARTAESALASFAGIEYDEAALIEAEERYKDYFTRYRDPAQREGVPLILDAIRESRAEKDFLIGQYYERTDHIGSAVFYYQNIRSQFPGSIAAAKSTERLELLGVSGMASKSTD